MYSLLLTTALPLLLTTAQAIPNLSDKRQVKVLAGAPISDIKVSADNLVQCGQSTISWSGAVAPYSLSISTGGLYLPSQQLETHPNLNDPSYGWTVTQPSGTGMYFQITDANGAVGYVQNVFVGESGDSSCLSASQQSSGSSSGTTEQSSTSSSAAAAASSSPASSPSSSSNGGGAAAAAPIVTVTSTSQAQAAQTSSSNNGGANAAAAESTSSSAGDVVTSTIVAPASAEQAQSSSVSPVVAVTTLTASIGSSGAARSGSSSTGTTSTAVVSGNVQGANNAASSLSPLGGGSDKVVGMIMGGLVIGMSLIVMA